MDKKPQKGRAPFETPMVLCCFVRWGRSRPWAWRGHIDGVSHLWGVPAPLVGFPSISRASGLVVCGRFPATVDQVDQKGPKRREKRALSKRFHRWELLPHFLCCCDGATPVQRLPLHRGALIQGRLWPGANRNIAAFLVLLGIGGHRKVSGETFHKTTERPTTHGIQ